LVAERPRVEPAITRLRI